MFRCEAFLNSNVNIHLYALHDLAFRGITFDLVDDGVHEVADGVAAEYLAVIDNLAEAFKIECVLGAEFFRVMVQQRHDALGIVDQRILERLTLVKLLGKVSMLGGRQYTVRVGYLDVLIEAECESVVFFGKLRVQVGKLLLEIVKVVEHSADGFLKPPDFLLQKFLSANFEKFTGNMREVVVHIALGVFGQPRRFFVMVKLLIRIADSFEWQHQIFWGNRQGDDIPTNISYLPILERSFRR